MADVTSRASTAQLPDLFARHSARSLIPLREDPPAPPAPGPNPHHPPTPPAPTPPAPTPPAPGPVPQPDPNAPDLSGLQTVLDQATASGRTEALQPLMAAVGVTTPEALQQWITAAHTAQQAQLSELERREQAATQAQAAAAAAAETAATATRNANVLAALLVAGAPATSASELIPLVTVPADADDAAIASAVEAAKVKFPTLFVPGATPPTPPAPSSRAPNAPPPAAPPANDPFAAGKERAKKMAARHQGATKDDLINDFTPGRSPLLPAS